MSNNMVSLANVREKMIETRKKAGISRDSMAVMCGVSGLTYTRWESGVTKSVTEKNYNSLCAVLENISKE